MWGVTFRGSKSKTEQVFECVKHEIVDPKEGEIRVELLRMSYDPLQKVMLSMGMWKEGMEPEAIGFGRIVESKDSRFKKDDHVLGMFPWRKYVTGSVDVFLQHPFYPIHKVNVPPKDEVTPEMYAGAFGVPAETAYLGMKYLLGVGPDDSGVKTLLVTGASGAVGTMAVQLARVLRPANLRIIGVAGSVAKLQSLKDEYGCDGVLSYQSDDLEDQLKKLCPDGIDYVLDSTGGPVIDECLRHMKRYGKIAVCGVHGCTRYHNMMEVVGRELTIEGFMLKDLLNAHGHSTAVDAIAKAYLQGQLKVAFWHVQNSSIADLGRLWNFYQNSHETHKIVFDVESANDSDVPSGQFTDLPVNLKPEPRTYSRDVTSSNASIAAVGSATSTVGASPQRRSVCSRPRVAVIGAFGAIARNFIKTLVNSIGSELGDVVILIRPDTHERRKDQMAELTSMGATIQTIHDFKSRSEMVQAFSQIDVVLSVIAGDFDQQIMWADAALEAGVKRFIPSEFGGCTDHPTFVELMPMKKKVRDHLEQITSKFSTMSWTALYTGGIMEYGAANLKMLTNPEGSKLRMVGEPDSVFCMTTGETLGKAVLAACTRLFEFRNRPVRVFDYSITLKDFALSAALVLGIDNPQVEWASVQQTVAEARQALASGNEEDGFAKLVRGVIACGASAFTEDDTEVLLRRPHYVPTESFRECLYRLALQKPLQTSVALIGCTGSIGSLFVEEIAKEIGQRFSKVSILIQEDTRKRREDLLRVLESCGAQILVIKDWSDVEEMKQNLAGHDVVVSATMALEKQNLWIDAAKMMGCKKFIPSEFGIDTVENPHAFPYKTATLEHLKEVCQPGSGMTYTQVFTGYILEHLVQNRNFYNFNAQTKTVDVVHRTDSLFACTTQKTLTKVMIKLCSQPDKYANTSIHVFDYQATVKELIHAVEVAEGCKYEVRIVEAEKIEAEIQKAMAEGRWMDWALHTINYLMGTGRGCFKEDDTSRVLEIGRVSTLVPFGFKVHQIIQQLPEPFGPPADICVYGSNTPLGADMSRLLSDRIRSGVGKLAQVQIEGCSFDVPLSKGTYLEVMDQKSFEAETDRIFKEYRVLVAVGISDAELMKLAEKAAAGGCRLLLVVEPGCDTDKPLSSKLFPEKARVSEHLTRLMQQHTGFEFRRIFTGLYLPMMISMREKIFSCSKAAGKMSMYGDSRAMFCASTAATVTSAVMSAASPFFETNRRTLYVWDYHISQSDLVEALSVVDDVAYNASFEPVESGMMSWEAKKDVSPWKLLLGSGEMSFTRDDTWKVFGEQHFVPVKTFRDKVIEIGVCKDMSDRQAFSTFSGAGGFVVSQ